MIKVFFYKGLSVVSKAIKWQTRSPVSHVAIQRGYGHETQTIEAWHKPFPRGNVHLHQGEGGEFKLHTPCTEVETYICPQLTNQQEQLMWGWLKSEVGVAYDFRMVFRFLPRWGATEGSEDKWFCSELIAAAFEQAHLPLLLRTPSFEVSPGLLRRSPLLSHIRTQKQTADGVVVDVEGVPWDNCEPQVRIKIKYL